jgi:hypothetical protein
MRLGEQSLQFRLDPWRCGIHQYGTPREPSSAIAFVNGDTPQEGWEVTGLDWHTGQTVHRMLFGQTNYGNGAYAIIQLLENGDLLFNSVGGPFRVAYE